MQLFFALVIGYLCGSLPSGYLYCKIFCHKDIRALGSGNVGATNTLRVAGKFGALIVMLADVGKCVLACYIGDMLGGQVAAQAAGVAAVCGHIFPIWLKFKGGKGVACGFGFLIYFWPLGALFGLAVFLIVVLVSGIVSAGSVLAAISVIFFTYFHPAAPIYLWPVLIIILLIIVKHKANIKRIIQGCENKILWKNRKLF
ncbi:MAG: glycerol-3-phosphate 1-O-acyltransferase PlsY [Clostridia bacterium]|nr:glycerol-3-phosphate 1-O-acyltransferase PlsY [Clostridia bacterium]